MHVSPRVAPYPVRGGDAGEAREASSAQVRLTYREQNNTVILESYFDYFDAISGRNRLQYRTLVELELWIFELIRVLMLVLCRQQVRIQRRYRK